LAGEEVVWGGGEGWASEEGGAVEDDVEEEIEDGEYWEGAGVLETEELALATVEEAGLVLQRFTSALL
jgi:hypothetical protein